jgi:peroxiredoxin
MAAEELPEDAIEVPESRRWPLLVVVAILVVVFGFVAWDQRPWAEDDVQGAGGLGMLASQRPLPGVPAPDFALETHDGERVTLSQFQGRPVFLNFWATWCTFCVEEMPDMQRVQDEFGDDLVVIGVNAGDSVEDGEDFARSVDIDYLRLYDHDLDVTDGYRVMAMPTSYFIEPDGTISEVNFGFMVLDQMREKVVAAMEG